LRLTALTVGGIQLDWQPGARQTGYGLYRFGDAGEALTALPGSATSHAETPPGSFVCYWLLPLEGDVVIASSDLACTYLGSANAPAPPSIRVRLDQGTIATVEWTAAGGAAGYVMYVAQAPERSQLVPPAVLSATDGTGGQFTCYAVLASVAEQIGNGPASCVAPGYSFGLGDPGPAASSQQALRAKAQGLATSRGGVNAAPIATRTPTATRTSTGVAQPRTR
jgi:hypothetical protein